MSNPIQFAHFSNPFPLELGKVLPNLRIAYHTYGVYTPGKSKVVWVIHALTANSNVFEWWAGLFGEEALFNPEEYYIICANNLGSCYGSTGPVPIGKEEGLHYHDFPRITIRDMVNAHVLLSKHLGIEEIHLLVGGSQGGQQALEWSIQEPKRINHLVLLATNAVHSPWGIAFNESQRLAIQADQSWKESHAKAGLEGLKAARSIALLSYRGYEGYGITQKESSNAWKDTFKAASYQQYQGKKLVDRFNAFSYWRLSEAMDSHNVGRNKISIEDALTAVSAKTLIISINTDILFPPIEQKFLHKHIKNSSYKEINSSFAHDGFLIETTSISSVISSFLNHS